MNGIPLRGGQFTSDVRLDRVREVDLRSLNYPASGMFTATEHSTPRSYTWGLADHFDQGQEGACVGFGFAHEAAAKPKPVKGLSNAFAREQVYWEAQKIDQWSGGSYPGASPVYEGTSVLAGARQMKELGLITEYRWAMSVNDLITAIGYHGPCVIGVDWYTGMLDVDIHGFIHASGNIAGGHCICAVGVRIYRNPDKSIDMLRSNLILHNSWGPNWGINGRARIALIDVAVLFPGGDFCVPVHRSKTLLV